MRPGGASLSPTPVRALSLPPDASPNYQSENGELYWELDVKSDEFGRDTHERHRIEVGPAQRTAPATGASAGA